MPDIKKQLRSELLQRVRSVTPEQREQFSQRAANLLFGSPEYAHAKTLLLFVSMPSEIDTYRLAEHAWSSGKRVAVPRAHLHDRSMEAIVVRSFADDMQRTRIGVLEPIGNQRLAPAEIDLVIVPGVGFGPEGQRIGHGAGFYDRFLADPQLSAITCGYAYEIQVIDNIPMHPRDVHLQMLVTDTRIRRFVRENAR